MARFEPATHISTSIFIVVLLRVWINPFPDGQHFLVSKYPLCLDADHTVPSGTGGFGHNFPGISCQATFTRSLRDNLACHRSVQIKLALMGYNP